MSPATPTVETFNLAEHSVRELNQQLHEAPAAGRHRWRVLNPGGAHSLAAGLDGPLEVDVAGHVGYYCAGMNKEARIRVRGNCGTGVAENMMSGTVVVDGDASQAAGATGRGGLLLIRGNAAARCAISLKGTDVIVGGSVGHVAGFLAQRGTLLVCGDAGEGLGDSVYETHIYVRGEVTSLGSDCIEKPMTDEHLAEVSRLLGVAELEFEPAEFRRFGSARRLYNFDIDNADFFS